MCEIDPIVAEVSAIPHPRHGVGDSVPTDVAPTGSVDDLSVCQEAKWLIGFWLNRATSSPRNSIEMDAVTASGRDRFGAVRVRFTIASQVDAIRHWKIYNRSYADCPSVRAATWFVARP